MGKVFLEPIEHVYIHEDTGEVFTSVTKVLHSFVPEFQTDKVAAAIAKQAESRRKPKYKGLNKEQILEMWKKENDDANEYGTKVHNIVETYLLNKFFYFPDDPFEKKIIQAFVDLNIDLGQEYYPERVMFAEEYALAGTSDLVIDIDEQYFDIGDYKTNKEFNYFSKYGNFLLPPFHYLSDCQYTIYSLQLSIYALMYEMETGKKCRRLYLMYHDKQTLEFQYIPVIYMKPEAKMIMDIHRERVAQGFYKGH